MADDINWLNELRRKMERSVQYLGPTTGIIHQRTPRRAGDFTPIL